MSFTYRNGEEAGHFAILESLGGGVGVLDFDNDGRMDLFFPGGGEFGSNKQIVGLTPAVFRNSGGWRFEDVTRASGAVESPHFSHGAAVGDYDDDGFADVAVTGYGGLALFANNGDGTFREAGAAASLDDRFWSSSAAWGDIDRDGHLDLYVAHYVDWSFENHPYCPGPQPGQREVCPPRVFAPLPDAVYLSNGDGTYRDASREAGLREDGKGLGSILADIDLDGDLDIYVTNDTEPNFLYQNERGGRLRDVSLLSGSSLSERGTPDGSMGVDVADFNLDGLPDLWVSNYERETFAVYRNLGNASFHHVSQSTGVSAVAGLFVGWGTSFFDFDLDGDEDVFVSNGHVIRYPSESPLRQEPLLFENLSGERFRNVASAAGDYLASPHMGRGVAAGDLDNDGRVDLVVSHVNEPAALLSNATEAGGRWLGLRLIGRWSSRHPVGALVTLRAGGSEQTRQVKGGGSYASSNDPRLHFGLGDAERVEWVRIRWPSGAVQELRDVGADAAVTVIEPDRDGAPRPLVP